MKAVLVPSQLKGSITAPASKSAMQRACAAALIRKGETVLLNPGISNDDKAALNIIQQLGAKVTVQDDKVIIRSNGVQPVYNVIDCHESGLSIRMFTSIAALSDQVITVKGSGSLSKRPMNFFDDVLPQLGVSCNSKGGYLPIEIQGPLQPKDITVDGSLSSQYLTGLLFAYAAADAKGVSIKVTNLNSRPYVDLTLQVLKSFGLKVPQNNNYEEFYFDEAIVTNDQPSITYAVEGDWSNAAFLLTGAAIAGDIQLKGMDMNSVQGDKAIFDVLLKANAHMKSENGVISVKQSELKAFEFDATDCPDLFPPLVALASHSKGISRIKGVHRLTHKESNRAATLQEEFTKLNIPVSFEDDEMIIEGKTLKAAEVSSHNDHRIAMATAVAGLKSEGEMVITGAEAVNKSYPQFWSNIKQLGAQLSIID
ncbi:3-phosphoshikimate 1-carboxyvinyltransferase [Chitinophagaceae bacterium LB-8]|uniref:3-phosphoshikimate 1-carboxyvinyltransferase n=1 Tax=Paraflavisolibacter caeni TaxID=2982496 RepID=A0A9X2XPX9_9BACT|nr:3-phosphoshikimate 1-carboxyvinyltransferase [Paraflavisolibacter caeni]MCU7552463.1 3-phosphoshikimate 1-carboxyvinyltransferase [Paraflavisolibacter caeni]